MKSSLKALGLVSGVVAGIIGPFVACESDKGPKSDSAVADAEGDSILEDLTVPEGFEKVAELSGSAATNIHKALGFHGDGELVRTLQGEGSVSCSAFVNDLPDGALGIVAPMANCAAVPKFDFPDGAVGIIAPWFSLGGLEGYQLWEQLPESGSEHRGLSGTFHFQCETNKCLISAKDLVDTGADNSLSFSFGGQSAAEVTQQLKRWGPDGSLDGEGFVTCTMQQIDPIPNGIVVPSVTCVGYPDVEFPPGTAGIVAPWFQLENRDGVELYEAMPTQADDSGTKALQGRFEFRCGMDQNLTHSCSVKVSPASAD